MEIIYPCYPFILLLNASEWKESSVGNDVDGLERPHWPHMQQVALPATRTSPWTDKPGIHRAAQMGHQPKWVPLHDLLRQNTTELISGQTN